MVPACRRDGQTSHAGVRATAARRPPGVDDPDPPDEPEADERAADRQPADGAVMRERAVRRAPDDEPRRQRRDARTRAAASDALKLMKLPRSRGSTLPVTSAVAGPKRPGTNTKKSTDNGTTQASGSGGRCVIDEDRRDRDHGEDREHAPLAVAIGEPADHLRRDERRGAAGEIDHREIGLGDADIGDVVGGDERDDREHRAHQHDHEGERAPVVGHAEDGPQLRDRAAARARRDVRGERGNEPHGRQPDDDAERGQHQERRAPRVVRGDQQRQRHAGDRRQRKGRRDDGRRRRAARVRHEIRDDREREPAQHAAERAGDDARDEQHRIVRARSRRAPSRR